MSRYINNFHWITPTPAIGEKLERGDMVKFHGEVTSIVDILYDRSGTMFLVLGSGAEVRYDAVEVIEAHYINSARQATAG